MVSRSYFSLAHSVKEGLFSDETFSFPLTLEEATLYAQGKIDARSTRLSYARSRGYIPEYYSDDDVQRFIRNMFYSYQNLGEKGEYTNSISGDTEWARKVYKQAVFFLVYSGVASLVTAGDWEVDRYREAEEALGITEGGLVSLESLLDKVYHKQDYDDNYQQRHTSTLGKAIHLHLGSGSGHMPHYLSRSGSLTQYSVADKIYFSGEPILQSLLWPHLRKYSSEEALLILKIVKSICENRFRKIAYNTYSTFEKNGMLSWEIALPFMDINLLRKILTDIKFNIPQALSGISMHPIEVPTLAATWEVKTSGIHQDDSSVILTLEDKKMVWEFLESMPLESPIYNFNELPEIYFYNLFLGDFLNVPDMISERVRLITSIRSDSHQKTPDFLVSTLQNIEKLDDGGVFLTDGGRESYTNYDRNGVLHEAISTIDGVESTIIEDIQTKYHHIMIQKSHPCSPLFDVFSPEGVSTAHIFDTKRFQKIGA